MIQLSPSVSYSNDAGSGSNSFRLNAIDQLRALAVICWNMAIFMPGIFPRLPSLASYSDTILASSRFATVAFVLVFGITMGFVHYDRIQSPSRSKSINAIFKRSWLILLCSFIFCIPEYVSLFYAGTLTFKSILLSTFSVLTFYTLAYWSAPAWLILLGKRPLRNAVLMGIGYWVAAYVALHIWPGEPPDGIGYKTTDGFATYLGVVLFWGPYAYLQAGGVALFGIPIGIYLRRALRTNTLSHYNRVIFFIGLATFVAGISIGLWSSELNLHALAAASVKSPPRVWYWMLYAGPALLALLALVALEMHVPTTHNLLYPLALLGQGALPLFTSASLVMMSLHTLDSLTKIEGVARVALAFGMYSTVCLIVMYYYHNKRRHRTETSQPKPQLL